MAWIAIPDINWEYSDTPNEDKKLIDTYDYDLHSNHVNGVIQEGDTINKYVLCRQTDNPHPGYGMIKINVE
jgi:hypothetical protein